MGAFSLTTASQPLPVLGQSSLTQNSGQCSALSSMEFGLLENSQTTSLMSLNSNQGLITNSLPVNLNSGISNLINSSCQGISAVTNIQTYQSPQAISSGQLTGDQGLMLLSNMADHIVAPTVQDSLSTEKIVSDRQMGQLLLTNVTPITNSKQSKVVTTPQHLSLTPQPNFATQINGTNAPLDLNSHTSMMHDQVIFSTASLPVQDNIITNAMEISKIQNLQNAVITEAPQALLTQSVGNQSQMSGLSALGNITVSSTDPFLPALVSPRQVQMTTNDFGNIVNIVPPIDSTSGILSASSSVAGNLSGQGTGILPGQASSLILTPTISSQVIPTPAVQVARTLITQAAPSLSVQSPALFSGQSSSSVPAVITSLPYAESATVSIKPTSQPVKPLLLTNIQTVQPGTQTVQFPSTVQINQPKVTVQLPSTVQINQPKVTLSAPPGLLPSIQTVQPGVQTVQLPSSVQLNQPKITLNAPPSLSIVKLSPGSQSAPNIIAQGLQQNISSAAATQTLLLLSQNAAVTSGTNTGLVNPSQKINLTAQQVQHLSNLLAQGANNKIVYLVPPSTSSATSQATIASTPKVASVSKQISGPSVHVQTTVSSKEVQFVQLKPTSVQQVKPGVFTFQMTKSSTSQNTKKDGISSNQRVGNTDLASPKYKSKVSSSHVKPGSVQTNSNLQSKQALPAVVKAGAASNSKPSTITGVQSHQMKPATDVSPDNVMKVTVPAPSEKSSLVVVSTSAMSTGAQLSQSTCTPTLSPPTTKKQTSSTAVIGGVQLHSTVSSQSPSLKVVKVGSSKSLTANPSGEKLEKTISSPPLSSVSHTSKASEPSATQFRLPTNVKEVVSNLLTKQASVKVVDIIKARTSLSALASQSTEKGDIDSSKSVVATPSTEKYGETVSSSLTSSVGNTRKAAESSVVHYHIPTSAKAVVTSLLNSTKGARGISEASKSQGNEQSASHLEPKSVSSSTTEGAFRPPKTHPLPLEVLATVSESASVTIESQVSSSEDTTSEKKGSQSGKFHKLLSVSSSDGSTLTKSNIFDHLLCNEDLSNGVASPGCSRSDPQKKSGSTVSDVSSSQEKLTIETNSVSLEDSNVNRNESLDGRCLDTETFEASSSKKVVEISHSQPVVTITQPSVNTNSQIAEITTGPDSSSAITNSSELLSNTEKQNILSENNESIKPISTSQSVTSTCTCRDKYSEGNESTKSADNNYSDFHSAETGLLSSIAASTPTVNISSVNSSVSSSVKIPENVSSSISVSKPANISSSMEVSDKAKSSLLALDSTSASSTIGCPAHTSQSDAQSLVAVSSTVTMSTLFTPKPGTSTQTDMHSSTAAQKSLSPAFCSASEANPDLTSLSAVAESSVLPSTVAQNAKPSSPTEAVSSATEIHYDDIEIVAVKESLESSPSSSSTVKPLPSTSGMPKKVKDIKRETDAVCHSLQSGRKEQMRKKVEAAIANNAKVIQAKSAENSKKVDEVKSETGTLKKRGRPLGVKNRDKATILREKLYKKGKVAVRGKAYKTEGKAGQGKGIQKKRGRPRKKSAREHSPEELPDRLKKPKKPKVDSDSVIDLTKSKMIPQTEKTFSLNDTVNVSCARTFKKEKWVCSLCNRPANFGYLDALYGPYKLKITIEEQDNLETPRKKQRLSQESSHDDHLEVWLHRDCAMWTPSICLLDHRLTGVGSALEEAGISVSVFCLISCLKVEMNCLFFYC